MLAFQKSFINYHRIPEISDQMAIACKLIYIWRPKLTACRLQFADLVINKTVADNPRSHNFDLNRDY